MIGVFVEVVVFQKQVATRNDPDITVAVAPDVHASGVVVSGLQRFGNFQYHSAAALYVTVDAYDAHWLEMACDKSIQIALHEMMFVEPTVVD